MRISQILKEKQPEEYKKLRQATINKKHKKEKKENLSFSDYMEMMKHDSYERHRGAIRKK